MNDKTINITEIARIAKVHPSTVSRALNGSPLIKEETRRWIEEIASEHGYIPDAVAKSLSQGKTSTLGVVVPEISNSFYAHIVDAIEQVMVQRGYSLLLTGTRFDPEAELRAIRAMAAKRVDALVVCAPSDDASVQLEQLSQRMPVILCDTLHDTVLFDSVCVEERLGIREAVRCFKQRGHVRIGCIADRVTQRRMEIFAEELSAAEIPVERSFFYQKDDLSVQCGYDGVLELARRGTPPSAVFAARDNLAIGAMRAAIELGLDVPNELALIGYDDISVSNFLYRRLTTIRQPADAIGKNVADLLLRRLDRTADVQAISTIRLIPELVVRESV